VATDQDRLPSAVVRITPAWTGTFYVRVVMTEAKNYGSWYCIMGQAPAPRPKPVPVPSPQEKVGYFRTEWIAPGSAEAIEAYFRPYYTIPSSKFVYDKYGRTRYSAGAMIFFDIDSAAIKPESIPLLNEWGRALRRGLSRGVFMVEGHTDITGSAEHNLKLSERRAQSVVNYLIRTWGISPVRLVPRGFGKLFPLDSNLTASGRATNRRVQFTLIDWLPY
jgi:OOP family OmpA-OmpF porin